MCRAILQKEELPASVMTPLRNTGSEEAEGTTLSQQMCVGYAGRGISAGVLRVPNSCMALARCPHSLPLSTALLSLAPSLCSPSRPSSSVTPSSLKPSLTYISPNGRRGWTPLRLLRGLQESRVATREESGVLGFPSRRGLTPRGSLECNPEIPAFPGDALVSWRESRRVRFERISRLHWSLEKALCACVLRGRPVSHRLDASPAHALSVPMCQRRGAARLATPVNTPRPQSGAKGS